jgi:hypothetical protein
VKRVRTLFESNAQHPMAATARMSIALPVELKDRMEAASKSKVINWSKASRRGIESELAFFEGQSPDQTAAIERLCMSKLESEHQDAIDGKTAGHEWAQNKAHYSFLKRLQRSVDLHLYDRPCDRLRMVLDPKASLQTMRFVNICWATVTMIWTTFRIARRS